MSHVQIYSICVIPDLNELRESIIKFSMELKHMSHLRIFTEFGKIMNYLSYENIFNNSQRYASELLNCLRYICKLVAHRRDIIEGYGEHDITWILLYKFP